MNINRKPLYCIGFVNTADYDKFKLMHFNAKFTSKTFSLLLINNLLAYLLYRSTTMYKCIHSIVHFTMDCQVVPSSLCKHNFSQINSN